MNLRAIAFSPALSLLIFSRSPLSQVNPHPRLFITGKEFQEIKKDLRGKDGAKRILKTWFKRIKAKGLKILEAGPAKYEIPDGLRLLATSRKVLERTLVLGFLYQVENDPRYLERGFRELESAASFPDWNPRHFLDTAEMTAAFAVGLDWFCHGLSKARRNLLVGAIVEKGLRQGLLCYEGKKRFGWWVKAHHNWNQVCNGGMILGSLAVLDERKDMAERIIKYAVKSLPRALSKFGPDGGWQEGPGYWSYAMSYTASLLCGLEKTLGDDFGLSRTKGLSEAGYFPIYITGPSGKTFNFADAKSGRISNPAFFFLSRRYKNKVFAWYETAFAKPRVLDILWFQEGGEGPVMAGIPLNRIFKGINVCAMRSSWGGDATFLAFKGGSNRANHGHLDLGTFVMDFGKERFAIDLGPDNYNLPGYWDRGRNGRRWTYYRMRAEGHNTLVIDPSSGPDQDPFADCRIVKHDLSPKNPFAVLDLSPAYKGRAKKVTRRFQLEKDKISITDSISPARKSKIYWFMHTDSRISLGKGKKDVLLEKGGVSVEARILGPARAFFEVMDAEPLPSSPHPRSQGRNTGIKKLVIKLDTMKAVKIIVQFRKK